MFLKAQSSRVFENVVQQIEDAIIGGEYAPGDRLPSEKELLEIMDVSRGTLRESLRALEQRGLIEIKQGAKGGIYVREFNFDQLVRSLDFFVRSQHITLDQLAQFREDLEGLLASRAASQASEKSLEELDHLLETASRQAQTGPSTWDDFMLVDRKIHMTLAKLAGNPLHTFFLETVYNYYHGPNVEAYLSHTQDVMEYNVKSLRAIVQAVKNGDEAQAEAMAKRHVRQFNRFMSKKGAEAKKAIPGYEDAGAGAR